MQGSQGKKFVFPFLSTSKLKITKYDFFPSPSVITSFFLPAVLTHLGCQKLATNYFSIRSPSPKKNPSYQDRHHTSVSQHQNANCALFSKGDTNTRIAHNCLKQRYQS